jgi:hypothetical protein
MCDYSLQAVKTRPASVGDKLITKNFGTGTRGFADANSPNPEDTAVCLLPGTEIAFEENARGFGVKVPNLGTVAIFRQIHKEQPYMHHDALEFPCAEGGLQTVLLTFLAEGQRATVLQLPAAPKTEAEAKEQERVEVVA